MYKLIAIDLDGTLLNDEKIISLQNINSIKKLINQNIEVVIATGRRYWSARELTKRIDRNMTILANNGNIVRNLKDDKTLSSKSLDLNDFRNVMEEGKRRDLYPIIHVDGYSEGYDILVELDKKNEKYHNFLKNESRLRTVENYLDIVDDKILAIVYPGYMNELRSFHQELNNKYPNVYNSHVMENIVQSEALLEVMHPKGNKWDSLLEYTKEKNINPNEIITIGDDSNDMGMIENAGLGIAMKNANESVKSVANIITEKDNNESGVAFELQRVLSL